MDVLAFVAALIESLSWPLAAIVITLVFRKPLTRLLHTAKRIKGLGIEFERDIEQLQSEVAQLPMPKREPSAELGSVNDGARELQAQILAVAEIAPVAAISLGWTAVEHRLRELARSRLPEGKTIQASFAIKQIQTLHQGGIIDSDTAALLHRMRELRNHTVHRAYGHVDVTLREARSFGDVAAAMVNYLDSIRRASGS